MASMIDVVLLGASGFTGKRVLQELIRVALPSGKRIAIAGRSRSKLQSALAWALGGEQQHSSIEIPVFEANVEDPSSLAAICSKTRLVLSCVGPYRLYGEPIVAACVEAGVDYLDVSGEPEFMERVEAKYHEQALNKGSLVVSACGYDSVPAELGTIFNKKQWTPPSLPNSIDAYLTVQSSTTVRGNFTTFESAVLGVGSMKELQQLRKSRVKKTKFKVPGTPLKRAAVHWEDAAGGWAIKLPAADAVVVRRTLTNAAENPDGVAPMSSEEQKIKWSALSKPVHFGVFLTVGRSIWQLALWLLFGLMFMVLASFSFGRKLLLDYGEVLTAGRFTRKGPSDEEVKSASFTMTFVARGYKDAAKARGKVDKEIVTRIRGPEIGYVTTPIIMVQAALVVLEERQSLPKGGVYTPGIAFGATDLQERLEQNGICFEVVSIKDL